jgi:hypothetical protein
MTIPAKVTDFLRTHKGQSYCDECLRNNLGLARPQQVQQITSTLETVGCFPRVRGECSICQKTVKVIRAT